MRIYPGMLIIGLLLGSLISPVTRAEIDASAELNDRIEVTATKRAEPIDDLPFTVQVIDEQALRLSGYTTLATLLDDVAGVSLQSTQPGQGAITIRGISEFNTANIYGGTGAAVGLYLDDAPLTVAGLLPQAALFDIGRVEVLKGPQGTLFGEGSLAGTVRIISNRPNLNEFEGTAGIQYGSMKDGGNQRTMHAVINIPISIDRLGFRGMLYDSKDDGFIDRIKPNVSIGLAAPPNPILGPGVPNVLTTLAQGQIEKDVNQSEEVGGRFLLDWTPSDDFSIDFGLVISDAERGSRNQGSLRRSRTIGIDSEQAVDEWDLWSLTAERDTAHGSFVFTSSYFDRAIDYSSDQLGILAVANQFAVPLGFLAGVPYQAQSLGADFGVTTESQSYELRFVSDLGGSIEFVAGIYHQDRDFSFAFTTPTSPEIPAAIWNAAVGGLLFSADGQGDIRISTNSTTQQSAVFGELSYQITRDTQVTVGGRFFDEERVSDSSAFGVFIGVIPEAVFEARARDEKFVPRVSLERSWSEATNTYITYSEGFRSGGQNDLNALVPQVDLQTYDSELLQTWEAGLKGNWLDGRFGLRIAAFYNDWSDLQLVLAQGPGGAGEVIGNAGEARSVGLDVEMNWQLSHGISLDFGAVLMDASLQDSLLTIPNSDGSRLIPVPKGTAIPGVSEEQLTFQLNLDRPLVADWRALAQVGVIYRSASLPRLEALSAASGLPRKQEGWTRLDLRTGVENPRWSIMFFIQNIFDEDIIMGTLNTDPVSMETVYTLAAPRTVGVEIRSRF